MSLVSRNRLLAVAAIGALVVAAFLAPPLDVAAGGPGGDSGDGAGSGDGTPMPGDQPATATPSESADGSQPDRRPIDVEPGGGGGSDGDGQPTGERDVSVRPTGGDSGDGSRGMNLTGTEPHPDCALIVWDRLVSGDDATVILWHDRGPVEGNAVWFENRTVGRTDQAGRVDGTVPYVRDLNLTAAAPPVPECALLHLEMETDFDRWQAERDGTPELVLGEDADVERVPTTGGNVSATLPVVGNASVSVLGDAYPGTEVRVNATVEGVPMDDATVAVDGEPVGEIDDRGFANVTVPDDGSESFEVSVSRGEFAASETVEVLLLSLSVSADALFALPGGTGTVEATVGDRPAPDVRVTAAGDAATTDSEGRASIELPGDPLATVHGEGHGQATTAAVWPVYLPTVVVALLLVGLVAGTVAASARGESGPSPPAVVAVWLAAIALVAATVLAGSIGTLAVIGLIVAGLLVRYRSGVRRTLGRLRTVPRVLVRWIHVTARWLADLLGRAADGLITLARALLARLRAAPRSIGAILAIGLRWLAGVPGRVARFLVGVVAAGGRRLVAASRRLLSWLLRPRGVVAAVGSLALVAGSYELEGRLGAGIAIVVVLLVALALAAWRWLAARETGTATDAPPSLGDPPAAGTAAGGSGSGTVDRPTLRELWRTFARWVVPGRWRSRTPGEVGRTAVDRGLPREPVEQLTEVFREVEYGDRTLSEERWSRARAAFDALRTADGEEERGER